MRRALGEGPEALALALAAVWLVGTSLVPLAHAAQHESAGLSEGHCHGAVCHDVERSDGPALRDGSLPDLGDLRLSHGVATAVVPTLVILVPPALEAVAAAWPPILTDRCEGRSTSHRWARGPPTA